MKRLLLCVGLLAVLATVLWLVFEARYCRTLTLRNLAKGETQTASVSSEAVHLLTWEISGTVNGTGVVIVPNVYSNRVSGPFSASGRNGYSTTNVSVRFIPEGKADGEIKASFRFHEWHRYPGNFKDIIL